MTVSLMLLIAMVVLYSVGFTLLLDRGLTRILLGFLFVGNATNLLIFLMAGEFGKAPLTGTNHPDEMTDPLPQAFILTAIVITFAVSAFLLALIYRSYRLDTEEQDDVYDDDADVELSSSESITTEEVTQVDLQDHSDFDDEATAKQEEAQRDREAEARTRAKGERE